MGSGVKRDAFSNYGTALNTSNTLGSQASNLYGSLMPQLTNQSINPQGYDPTTLAKMRTSALQTAGGSSSGGVGAGKLYEMRSRNAGAAGNAIATAAQNAGETLGKANLGIDVGNARLKEQQRSEAQHEMGGLYNTELGASLNALGLSNNALNIANNAKPSFWQTMAMTAGKNLVNAGADAGEAALGF